MELKGDNGPVRTLSHMEAMLTENDVVDAVIVALQKSGWNIRSYATTMQQGVDIVASLGKRLLYVEAKGITSSKESSNRYGKLHNSQQMFISVAAALLKAAEMRQATPEAAVAIALPAHPTMRQRIKRIETVLEASDIAVLWVAEDWSVSVWNGKWFKRLANVEERQSA